jgi:hypothetical protein
MPITPNIIQTMKQTVKARVLTMSTLQAWRGICGVEVTMARCAPVLLHDCLRVHRHRTSVAGTYALRQKEEAATRAIVLKN